MAGNGGRRQRGRQARRQEIPPSRNAHAHKKGRPNVARQEVAPEQVEEEEEVARSLVAPEQVARRQECLSLARQVEDKRIVRRRAA